MRKKPINHDQLAESVRRGLKRAKRLLALTGTRAVKLHPAAEVESEALWNAVYLAERAVDVAILVCGLARRAMQPKPAPDPATI
jgi:hypothetical protein